MTTMTVGTMTTMLMVMIIKRITNQYGLGIAWLLQNGNCRYKKSEKFGRYCAASETVITPDATAQLASSYLPLSRSAHLRTYLRPLFPAPVDGESTGTDAGWGASGELCCSRGRYDLWQQSAEATDGRSIIQL